MNSKNKSSIILIASLILIFSGCSEIITITGIAINRLSNRRSVSAEIVVNVVNPEKKRVRNFAISVKENYSNKYIADPKISGCTSPVSFSLPDEQIISLPPEASKIIISADGPGQLHFEEQIDVSSLEQGKIFTSEIVIGFVPDSLLKPPLKRGMD